MSDQNRNFATQDAGFTALHQAEAAIDHPESVVPGVNQGQSAQELAEAYRLVINDIFSGDRQPSGFRIRMTLSGIDPMCFSSAIEMIRELNGGRFVRFTLEGDQLILFAGCLSHMLPENLARRLVAFLYRLLPKDQQQMKPFCDAVGMSEERLKRGLSELEQDGLSIDLLHPNDPGAGRPGAKECFADFMTYECVAAGISREEQDKLTLEASISNKYADTLLESQKGTAKDAFGDLPAVGDAACNGEGDGDSEKEPIQAETANGHEAGEHAQGTDSAHGADSTQETGSDQALDGVCNAEVSTQGTDSVQAERSMLVAYAKENLTRLRENLSEMERRLQDPGVWYTYSVYSIQPYIQTVRSYGGFLIETGEKYGLLPALTLEDAGVSQIHAGSEVAEGDQSAENSGQDRMRELICKEIVYDSAVLNTSLKAVMASLDSIGKLSQNRTRVPHRRLQRLKGLAHHEWMKRRMNLGRERIRKIEESIDGSWVLNDSLSALLKDLPVIRTDENDRPIADIEEGLRSLKVLEEGIEERFEERMKSAQPGSAFSTLISSVLAQLKSVREWLLLPVPEEVLTAHEAEFLAIQASVTEIIDIWLNDWNASGNSRDKVKRFARTLLTKHRGLMEYIKGCVDDHRLLESSLSAENGDSAQESAIDCNGGKDPEDAAGSHSVPENAADPSSEMEALAKEVLSAADKDSSLFLQTSLSLTELPENLDTLIRRLTREDAVMTKQDQIRLEALKTLQEMKKVLSEVLFDGLSDEACIFLAQSVLIGRMSGFIGKWLNEMDACRTVRKAEKAVCSQIASAWVRMVLYIDRDSWSREVRSVQDRAGRNAAPDEAPLKETVKTVSGKNEDAPRKVTDGLRLQVQRSMEQFFGLLNMIDHCMDTALSRKKDAPEKKAAKASSIPGAREKLVTYRKMVESRKACADKSEDYYLWSALQELLDQFFLPKAGDWYRRCCAGVAEGGMPTPSSVDSLARSISGVRMEGRLTRACKAYEAHINQGDSTRIPVTDELMQDVRRSLNECYENLDMIDAWMAEALSRRRNSSKTRDYTQDARKKLSELRKQVQEKAAMTDSSEYSYIWSALHDFLQKSLLPRVLDWKKKCRRDTAEGYEPSYSKVNEVAKTITNAGKSKKLSDEWDAYEKSLNRDKTPAGGHLKKIPDEGPNPFSGMERLSIEEFLSLIRKFYHERKDPRDIRTWIDHIMEVDYARSYGDPTKEKVCCRITRQELSNAFYYFTGMIFSPDTLWDILVGEMRYTGRQCQKLDQVGDPSPCRDKQFRYIKSEVDSINPETDLILSVDTKAFILLGRLKRDNTVLMCAPGSGVYRVHDHDFAFLMREIYPDGTDLVDPSRMNERAILHPVGAYCKNDNTGYISLVIGADTAESMANLIIQVIEEKRRDYMPDMKNVLILADGGGANMANGIQWQRELLRVADETGMNLKVCHYPSGTSKHNPVEHCLFGPISRHMAGRPALNIEQVARTIQETTAVPKNGGIKELKVTCWFDSKRYLSLSEKKKDPRYKVWTREDLENDPEAKGRITHPFEIGTDMYKLNYTITPSASARLSA